MLLARGAVAATTGAIGLDTYLRSPLPFPRSSGDPADALEALLPRTPPKTMVLVFPGAGGPDANSAAVVEALRRARRGSVVLEFDWREWVGGELRGSANGRTLGAALGTRLAKWAEGQSPPGTADILRCLHIIGISVGAQAADAACGAFAVGCRETQTHRRLTLLDPFTASGLLGLAFAPRARGVLRFGACDRAQCNAQPPCAGAV